MYRPNNDWENPHLTQWHGEIPCIDGCDVEVYEAGADAIVEGLKKEGLYGEYLKDYIISVAVKPDDRDWAEPFLARIETKGWLVFIPEEE